MIDNDLIIARGKRARRLLADPDIQQAFDDLRDELFSEWQYAQAADARESLHATSRGIDRIRNKLQAWSDELIALGYDG